MEHMVIRTNEGLTIVIEETLPYEPANYVTEEYIHLGYIEGQLDEYPLYLLGASGIVQIQRDEYGPWEDAGSWSPPQYPDR